MIYQSEAPVPKEISVRKHQIDTAYHTSSLSSSTVETGLTGVTRVNIKPQKRITKKKKYIKFKALPPIILVNKRLLNEDNDNNTKNTYTSLSEKYDISHTIPDDFTEKKQIT